MAHVRLPLQQYVDEKTGFLFHYVYSETEPFREHCHTYYEIFLTLEGEIEHRVNGEVQTLPEGSLVFIRPDDIHLYLTDPQKKYRFINFTFTCETAQAMFAFLSDGFAAERLLSPKLPPVVYLDKKEKIKLFSKFEQLNTVEWENDAQKKFRMRVLLGEIFSTYFAPAPTASPVQVPLWLENVCKAMNRKENFEKGAAQMVALSGHTREHLARCMKKYYNTTVSEFLNDLKLNYCANMLTSSNMPVLDICFESGFSNVSWFYKQFTARYGLSPKAFRQKYAIEEK